MDNIENTIHRGQVLKKAVKERGISVPALMKKMGYGSRSTFYEHIKKPDLAIELLKEYSEILGEDLVGSIPGQSAVGEDAAGYTPETKSYAQLLIELKYWRDSHAQLQKEYNELKTDYEELVKKM